MPETPTDGEIVKIFERIIEKRHRQGFFAMESFWDKILILISKIPKKYMSDSVHKMFLRRRYWYTLVVYSAIKEIGDDFEVVKTGYKFCAKMKSVVGIRSIINGEDITTFIKENQFEELSNNTIDVRPHAILSIYEDVKTRHDFSDLKVILLSLYFQL
jgi:hypothetical protein